MKLFIILPLLLISSPMVPLNFTSSSSDDIVIITGFEPFDTWEINPSQIAVETLNDTIIQNYTIVGLVLPVDYASAFPILVNAINKYHPSVIINFGLKGTARQIEIEQLAINLKRERVLSFSIIAEGGNIFYKSTFPYDDILDDLSEKNIRARLSYNAGFYLCNYIMYLTLDYIAINNDSIKAGFIHLPPLAEQTSYGMELDKMLIAAETAVESCIS